MRTTRISGIRGFILAIALSVGPGFISSAFGDHTPPYNTSVILDPDGKLTRLGNLGGVRENLDTIGNGINDSGQVAGYSYATGGTHAFITGPNGVGITDLGTLGGYNSYAYGINAAGRVVGSSYTTEQDHFAQHAFITGPNGAGMTDLGTLGGTHSVATAINDAGRVVGESSYTNGYIYSRHAFITGPGGVGMTDLGTLGGSESNATGINETGQVVGSSSTAEQATHAFITGPNGVGMTDLGTLGGTHSVATGINEAGQVAGWSTTGESDDSGFETVHSFITGPDGVGMTDLGTLGLTWTQANDINDAGQVAGESFAAYAVVRDGFVTGANGAGITSLDSYADLHQGDLRRANGINNLGQVVAISGSYLPPPPIPEPASYALMLAGLGLVGFMVRRKKPMKNTVERG